VANQGAELAGVAIALDRQERGTGEQSAVQEVQSRYGVPVINIVSLQEISTHIQQSTTDADLLARIQAYRQQYGV
jgi:orotate phosphoribosyltransferase